MKKFILIVLSLFLTLGVFAQTNPKKVGIYITGEININYKKVFVAKLISQITQTDGYIAVERTNEFLSALSHEQDYQISGAVSDNEIARLGAQFGVDYVLVADLSELFDEIFVSARSIDVETAQIVAATEQNSKVDSMQSLTNLANNLAKKFINAIKYGGIISKVKVIKFSAENFVLLNYRYKIIDDVDLVKYILDSREDVDLPIVTGIKDLQYMVIYKNNPRYGGAEVTGSRYQISYLAGSHYGYYTSDIEVLTRGSLYLSEPFERHPFNLCYCLCIDKY